MSKYKIGFIDEDHLEWERVERNLRDSFDVVDYSIPQGLSKENLIEQVYDSDIDLLMVDYLMCDTGYLNFNGDDFIRDFEKIKPKFPIIIFTTHENDAFPHVDNPNIIYDKKLLEDDRLYLVQLITKNIERYRKYISDRKDIIETLLQKKEKQGLSSKEKNTLLESQLELNILDKKSNEVPLQLIEDKSYNSLSDTTKEAEAFLESIEKKVQDDSFEK